MCIAYEYYDKRKNPKPISYNGGSISVEGQACQYEATISLNRVQFFLQFQTTNLIHTCVFKATFWTTRIGNLILG